MTANSTGSIIVYPLGLIVEAESQSRDTFIHFNHTVSSEVKKDEDYKEMPKVEQKASISADITVNFCFDRNLLDLALHANGFVAVEKEDDEDEDEDEDEEEVKPVKRGRGRPSKKAVEKAEADDEEKSTISVIEYFNADRSTRIIVRSDSNVLFNTSVSASITAFGVWNKQLGARSMAIEETRAFSDAYNSSEKNAQVLDGVLDKVQDILQEIHGDNTMDNLDALTSGDDAMFSPGGQRILEDVSARNTAFAESQRNETERREELIASFNNRVDNIAKRLKLNFKAHNSISVAEAAEKAENTAIIEEVLTQVGQSLFKEI